MREFLTVTRALSDPQRLRLLLALRGGERCVCQLVELLNLAGSTVSKHLSVLQHAGLIRSRKEERWVHYRLTDRKAGPVVGEALDWVFKSLARSSEATGDRKRLQQILKQNPSDLCKRQCRN